jgi:hypothetical protein
VTLPGSEAIVRPAACCQRLEDRGEYRSVRRCGRMCVQLRRVARAQLADSQSARPTANGLNGSLATRIRRCWERRRNAEDWGILAALVVAVRVPWTCHDAVRGIGWRCIGRESQVGRDAIAGGSSNGRSVVGWRRRRWGRDAGE